MNQDEFFKLVGIIIVSFFIISGKETNIFLLISLIKSSNNLNVIGSVLYISTIFLIES